MYTARKTSTGSISIDGNGENFNYNLKIPGMTIDEINDLLRSYDGKDPVAYLKSKETEMYDKMADFDGDGENSGEELNTISNLLRNNGVVFVRDGALLKNKTTGVIGNLKITDDGDNLCIKVRNKDRGYSLFGIDGQDEIEVIRTVEELEEEFSRNGNTEIVEMFIGNFVFNKSTNSREDFLGSDFSKNFVESTKKLANKFKSGMLSFGDSNMIALKGEKLLKFNDFIEITGNQYLIKKGESNIENLKTISYGKRGTININKGAIEDTAIEDTIKFFIKFDSKFENSIEFCCTFKIIESETHTPRLLLKTNIVKSKLDKEVIVFDNIKCFFQKNQDVFNSEHKLFFC